MRIGVYVGSFNPVHKGHKAIVDYLLENKYVDKIEMIPTCNYWNKGNLIDLNHRIKMLKFYETDNIKINTELNNLEYTYQILRKLKCKENKLYLIIGADNILKFHLWKKVEELLNYNIIVIPRNNLKMDSSKIQFREKENIIFVKNFKQTNIKSTDIREKIKKGSISELTKLLDKKVLNYIIEKNLYKGDLYEKRNN